MLLKKIGRQKIAREHSYECRCVSHKFARNGGWVLSFPLAHCIVETRSGCYLSGIMQDCILTRLRPTRSGFRVPPRERNFSHVQGVRTGFWGPPILLFKRCRWLSFRVRRAVLETDRSPAFSHKV
jgi:hypothetical protein